MRQVFTLNLMLMASFLWGQTPRLVVPNEHYGWVSCAAFSPNGKMVLIGYGKTAKLWDISGRELATFSTNSLEFRNQLNWVAFSPNGETVITGYEDGWVILSDLSGKELKKINARDVVLSIAYSPDCKTILIGGSYNGIQLWDLANNQILPLKDSDKAVMSGVFSPDGKTFLTRNSDSTATLLSLSGEVFSGHAERVAFSADGKNILTGMWELSGKELMTFSTVSPDGKTVLMAIGDTIVKLMDLSGRELQSFRCESFLGGAVAFSPDGKNILIGGKKEANLWDLNGQRVASFSGHVTPVEPVSFSHDGTTIQMGNDKTAYRWNLSARTLESINLEPDIKSFAFSPDGKMILTISGSPDEKIYRDERDIGKRVKCWDLSGKELQSFNHGKLATSIAFSPDGKTILIGGTEGASLWDINGTLLQNFVCPNNTCRCRHNYIYGTLLQNFGEPWVTFVAFSPDGKLILTGQRNDVTTMWDLSGRELLVIESLAASDYGAFSPDGQTIMLCFRYGMSLYDLSGKDIGGYSKTTDHGISARFSPDGKTIMAYDDLLMPLILDYSGKEISAFTGEAPIAFSKDGKFVLTGSFNTSNFYDVGAGKLLATLVVLDSTEWVVTTPSGLFDASPGAMNLMYFVVDYKEDLEVVELEQLKETYFEPGLLPKLLGFSDEPLREVEGLDTIQLKLYPAVQMRLDTSENKLHLQLHARNGGVGKLSIFINGKEVKEEANPPRGFERQRDTSLIINLADYARYFLSDSLNEVSVRAYNAEGWLKSAAHSVEYRPVFAKSKGDEQDGGSVPIHLEGAPNLFILSVGTSDYAGTKLDLKYAAKDAVDIAGALEQIGKQLLKDTPGRVFSTVLSTDSLATKLPPTKANIQKAFEDIKKNAKAEDILVVYFSGHGLTKGNDFYYLTQAMSSFEVELEGKGKSISNTELTRWVTGIPALKQVLILDACNSGKVVESLANSSKGSNSSQIRALERLKDRTGMFVLSGSAADKLSYESGKFDQGLLTYSLLQGMKMVGSKNETRVDVMQWFQRSCDEVPLLAKGIQGVQTPMLVGPLRGSFDVGIVNKEVNITLKEELPVVIRCNFLNEDLFADDLGLTQSLETKLQSKSVGAKPEIIYVDVDDYEGAFSICGLYRVSNGKVNLRGQLFKGKTLVGQRFEISTSVDLSVLSNAVLNAIWKDIMKK